MPQGLRVRVPPGPFLPDTLPPDVANPSPTVDYRRLRRRRLERPAVLPAVAIPAGSIGIRPTATWQLVADERRRASTPRTGPACTRCSRRHRFRSVLNCTGNCALKSCELDPAMARRTNVDSAVNIAEASRRFGARLVHLSSDLVYSGKGAGGYVETDPVDPVTVYGRTMAEGERIVREIDPGAAILRISLPMGPSFNRHAGAIDWIQSRFRHGRPATLYFDEVRSCTYTDDLNRVFERFLAGDEAGLFHCGGPRADYALSDRPDRQSRRRLRPAAAEGVSADRGGAGAAAGREREHGQRQADRGAGRRPVPAVAGGRGVVSDGSGMALHAAGGRAGRPAWLAARLYRYPAGRGLWGDEKIKVVDHRGKSHVRDTLLMAAGPSTRIGRFHRKDKPKHTGNTHFPRCPALEREAARQPAQRRRSDACRGSEDNQHGVVLPL